MNNLKKSANVVVMMLLTLTLWSQQATNITFNEIPVGGVHRQTDKYVIKANGVELPVVDGLCMENGKATRGYLHFDYTTFSASTGKVTINLKCKDDITSIQVSPLKQSIELRKIDSKTYEFDIPEPVGDEQYYTIAQINGNRVVIARDAEETNVPVPGTAGVFNVADKLVGIDATAMSNTVAVGAAIQSAVNEASAYGLANDTQGSVYVPQGLYYMGNLMLKSNTSLYLAAGSVLRFSDNLEDYRNDFRKTSLDRNGTWWIYTEDQSENIKIYGRGTIDGNGHYLQKDCPSNRRFANNLLMIMGTQNFVFDGPILKEAAFWGTIVARSNDVVFRNAKFFNSMDANENDGIDVCESQRVRVEKAIGIALDDPFSTKTWAQSTDICPNWYGSPEELEDVTFLNCVSLTYCGAFKCGHGAMQKQSR
ncbi:MAG: glycosyl hydrolase family 28 protein, partial [Dysgonomonas sp.]